MLNTLRNNSIRAAGLKTVLAAVLLAGSAAASAAAVTVDLCATTGTTTGTAISPAVTVWGYANGVCPSVAVPLTAPGGPVIAVNAGDAVTVNLYNGLATEATGLLVQGQAMVPDTTGIAAGTPTTPKTYTFTATNPGTYLYQAAPLANAEHQVAMGLYGALVVRPAANVSVFVRTDTNTTTTLGSADVVDAAAVATDVGLGVSGIGIPAGTTVLNLIAGGFTMSQVADATAGIGSVTFSASKGSAYGTVATAYDDESVLVLSEIDPALNGNATPTTFDMRNFAPKYFLINGKAYPNTDGITSAAGHKLLLRYVNAGSKHHSMGVLGLRQNFIAKDGSTLPTADVGVTAETLAPGQTGDALISVPAVTTASRFAVYDASLNLHNSNAAGFGGMLTFVSAGAGAAVTGPTTSGVTLTPNPTNGTVAVALSASIASVSSTVTAAEYFIDTPGAGGAGTPMSGTTSATATLSVGDLALLSSGNHTIYVHGRDAASQWGSFASATLNLDKTGPTTSGLTLTPNPSNGSVAVALHATANDSATGGANIAAAEYFIGATGANGTGVVMTVNTAAPVASLDATIAAPVTAGLISVHGKDARGNWGPFATITLSVVAAGPVTSAVSAAPNPNNGAKPLNSSQPVVRVTATMSSTGSTVSGAEAFIDTVRAIGTGFPFVPSDGVWNGASETGTTDIPLATINSLTAGNHTIYVRGRDAVGNWGATSTTILVIDKTAPTVSGVTLTPSAANSAAVLVNANASDAASNIASAEFFVDTVGAPGTGTAMTFSVAQSTALSGTISSATVAALAAGNHTVSVRARDAAGNWSATSSATLLIDRTAPTFTGITLASTLIPVGTVSVNLTVNGSADPTVGGLASGVAGGEWWIGSTNITAGTGTAFNGLMAAVATNTLTVGTYTVRVRIRDAAGNWSTGTNGVGTATLNVRLPAPTVSKAFAGSVRGGNGTQAQRTTTLTITLTNPNADAIAGAGLIDNLPQPALGTLTALTGPTTTCGGTVARQNTNQRLVLTGGTIPANGSCTVTATVRISGGATNGPYTLTNTIPVGGVTATNALSNTVAASANLTVTL